MQTAGETEPATAANSDGQGGKTCLNIEPERDFLKALQEHGLHTDGRPIADGKIHRFHVQGDSPGSKNGWYVLHADGKPAGKAGSWKTRTEFTWNGANGATMTASELAAMDAKIREAKRQRDAEHKNAAKTALEKWEAATPVDVHPYLERKRVKSCGLRASGDLLLVPAFNAAGNIQTLQTIDAEGGKRFHPGGKAAGAFFMIGEPPRDTLYVVEGYATGATVHDHTGEAVAVAFNCGNLKTVTETMATEYPEARIIVVCDNDTQTEGNPGLTEGTEAAKAVQATYAFPVFTTGKGTDFNDLAKTEPEAVKRCLANEYATRWPQLDKVQLAPLPPFPWDTLPPVLSDHARQVAACYQVPPEYPAMAALTVAGFAMGNRTFVTLKPGVRVRPNLYVMVIMASGERKSSPYRSLTIPLEEYATRHAEQWEELKAERRIHAAKVARLEKRLSQVLDANEEHEVRRELNFLPEPVGTCKDFLAENATEEALQVKLAECGERAAVFSADSRDVLQVLTGIYSDNQNRETTYLKAYDGDSLRVHRMGRTLHLQCPAISLLLCVQTDKLRVLGANAGLHDGGFLPRVLFIVPDSLVGSRSWTEAELDPAIHRQYSDAVTARLDKYAEQSEDFTFPLDPEAKTAWVQWYNALEEDMAGELAEQAPLAVRWQSLPIRLSAILAEYSDRNTITEPDMQAAIELSGYLIEHGRRATAIMNKGLSKDLKRAVSHLRSKGLREFTANGLRRALNASASECSKWLQDLETAGYVRQTGKTEGHKRASVYESNPEIWS